MTLPLRTTRGWTLSTICRPLALALLAGALVAGAISFSSYSRAQGSREQLLGEMERLINQMQALRDRLLSDGILLIRAERP